MKLRNPFLVENLYQDQPYASLVFMAPFCDFKCKGCQNRVLHDFDVIDFSIEELMEKYQSNPFVEGITIGGLEITQSQKEFIEDLLTFIQRAQIPQVTIYTREEKDHPMIQNLIEKISAFSFVQEFFIKTGKFLEKKEKNNLFLQNKEQHWTLNLASNNQNFHIIKSQKWKNQSLPPRTIDTYKSNTSNKVFFL